MEEIEIEGTTYFRNNSKERFREISELEIIENQKEQTITLQEAYDRFKDHIKDEYFDEPEMGHLLRLKALDSFGRIHKLDFEIVDKIDKDLFNKHLLKVEKLRAKMINEEMSN